MSTCNKLEPGDGAVLPGFRFHPTDEELVEFYLRRKIQRQPLSIDLITQLDIYKFDPWNLPKMAIGEKEWYFFCPRDRKYRNSNRPNRVTGAGFWKATGTDRPIYKADGSKCIGLKKSLVFYKGRAGKAIKTDWMMHEFRIPPSERASDSNILNSHLLPEDSWAVCKIFKKKLVNSRCLEPRRSCRMPALSETIVASALANKIIEEHSPKLQLSDEGISFYRCTTKDEKSDTTSVHRGNQQLPYPQVKCEQDSCITTESTESKQNKEQETKRSGNQNIEDEYDHQLQEMARVLEIGQKGILTDLLNTTTMSPAADDFSIWNFLPNNRDNRNHQPEVWDNRETMHNAWAVKCNVFSPPGNQNDVYDLLKTLPWDTPLDQFSSAP